MATSEERESDEALAARARAGDAAAFEALLARHSPALRMQIRGRLPPLLRRKVAESDVIQMAYVGVHSGLGRFTDRGEGSFKAWLNQIVEHRIRDALRRYVYTEKRGLDHEVSGADVPSARHMRGRAPTPSALATANELMGEVHRAMGKLPEHYQLVLRLVQVECLTLAQAGERMGRSPGATEKLYGRALARLAQLVGHRASAGDG